MFEILYFKFMFLFPLCLFCFARKMSKRKAESAEQFVPIKHARAEVLRDRPRGEPPEEWRPIPGYDGYQASNLGRVRNRSRILSQQTKDGYCLVAIHPTTCRVHRLVALAFLPNPDNLPEVDHINAIRDDNNVTNLQWISKADNIHRAQKKLVRPVIAIDEDGRKHNFDSLTDADHFFECKIGTIWTYCTKNWKREYKGKLYTVKFASESKQRDAIYDTSSSDWKTLPFHELYECSVDGRVRNAKTKRVLQPGRNAEYLHVVLCRENDRKTWPIHRIIALTWLPNPDEDTKTFVNHIDGNKHNNAASNLEWCTPSQNNLHYHYSIKGINPIAQYDLTGKYIKTWDSRTKAARSVGVETGNISYALKDNHRTCGGFRWMEVVEGRDPETQCPLDPTIKQLHKKRDNSTENWRPWLKNPKYQVSRDGRVRNAAFELKTPQKHARSLRIQFSGGTIVNLNMVVAETWLEPDSDEKKTAVEHIDGNHQNCHVDNLRWTTPSTKTRWSTGYSGEKPCVQLDSNGKFVERFLSRKAAAQKTGIERNNIANVLDRKGHTAGGFLFRTENTRLIIRQDMAGTVIDTFLTFGEAAATSGYDEGHIYSVIAGLEEPTRFRWIMSD